MQKPLTKLLPKLSPTELGLLVSHLIYTDELSRMPVIRKSSKKTEQQGNFLNLNLGNVKPHLYKPNKPKEK